MIGPSCLAVGPTSDDLVLRVREPPSEPDPEVWLDPATFGPQHCEYEEISFVYLSATSLCVPVRAPEVELSCGSQYTDSEAEAIGQEQIELGIETVGAIDDISTFIEDKLT